MKIRIFLATATAASVLLASAAMAGDNNNATIKQDGNDNTASLVQNGSNNWIGAPTVNSTYGKVVSTGDDNRIDIEQNGNNNDIAHWAGGTANVKQDGDRNDILVRQYGGTTGYTGNAINNIDQDSEAGSSEWANVLSITQGELGGVSNRNVVGTVVQDNTAIATTATDRNKVEISQLVSTYGYEVGHVIRSVSQSGSANTLTIQQSGNNNYVDVTKQVGAGNTGTIKQFGGGQNTVALLSQDVKTSLAGGNTAFVSLDGNKNGTGATGKVTQKGANAWGTGDALYAREDFYGLVTVGAASVADVEQAKIVQEGGGNDLSYDAKGNNNLFGFTQKGDNNSATGTVVGDRNQIAAYQNGNLNTLHYLQTGNDNTAGASVAGSSNNLNLKQVQSGGLVGNRITVSITGDSNGTGTFAGAMSSLASANGLVSGDIHQSGDDHSVTLTVTSSLNAFAFEQLNGSGSTITATVGGLTGGNKAVGVQNGNDHTATLTQNGNTNNALFHQIGGNNTVVISQ